MSQAPPQDHVEPNALTFGTWLRQQRHACGLTQDELAADLACSPALLRKLEAGERRPSGQIAALLASYFHLPGDEHAAFVAFARTGRMVTLRTNARTGPIPPAAPWRHLYRQQTNLPAVLTSLIGRALDVAATRDQLLSPKIRLLTLTGAPGIGKTRLGIEVAQELVDHFQDGVFFVDLAPLHDPGLVLEAIARSLGLKETGDQPIEQVLAAHVAERRMLLLLDNFEQVLDAAAPVVHLLEGSPWLKLLVTSREALHVRGERRVPVTPLGLPDPQPQPSAAQVRECAAVMLFVERAQAVAPAFVLTDENADDVAAICLGLDGLPLALELAAGRADHFTPREIRSGLGSCLTLLTGGARDLPPRQRTLRGAFTWSYDLLDANEQRLFRRLAVFVGGCTREAAATVCGWKDDEHVLLSLESLLDNSLLQQRASVDGVLRVTMLETIRDYALDRLQVSGDADTVWGRHAGVFLALAEAAHVSWHGPQETVWLDRLADEQENLRATLSWALDHHGVELAGRLGVALCLFWDVRGQITEGRGWIERVLVHADALSLPLRARLIAGAAEMACRQGDDAHGAVLATAGLVVCRTLEDQRGCAWLLNTLGSVAYRQDGHVQATALWRESLALFQALGDSRGTATLLKTLGEMTHNQGDEVQATALFTESLVLFRQLGDRREIAFLLDGLADVALRQGDYARARGLQDESLALFRQLGDQPGIADALLQRGRSSRLPGGDERAVALLTESFTLFRAQGISWGIAAASLCLGDQALAQGNYAAAGVYFQDALAINQEHGNALAAGWALIGLAAVECARGDASRAMTLLEQSLTGFRTVDHTYGIAEALLEVGRVAILQANHARAIEVLTESLRLFEELGDRQWIIKCLLTLAGLLGVHGAQPAGARRAARLLGAVQAARAMLKLPPLAGNHPMYDGNVAAMRACLDQEEFEAARVAGQAMDLEEAIASALVLPLT